MCRIPGPSMMASVQRTANSLCPVALGAVAHLVHRSVVGIDEPNGFAVVGELALSVAGDIFDAWMQFGESRCVRRNDKSAVWWQVDFAEGEPDTGVEFPAVERDRLAAVIP